MSCILCWAAAPAFELQLGDSFGWWTKKGIVRRWASPLGCQAHCHLLCNEYGLNAESGSNKQHESSRNQHLLTINNQTLNHCIYCMAPLLRSQKSVYFIGFFVLNFHLEWSFQDLPPTSGDDRFFPSLLGPMFVDGKNGREFLEALGVRKLHTCFWRYHEPPAKWGAAIWPKEMENWYRVQNRKICIFKNAKICFHVLRVLLVKELSECCEALPEQIAECKTTRAISIHNCLLQLHFM